MNNSLLFTMVWSLLGMLATGWLIFTVAAPKRHSELTDNENAFAAKLGLISKHTAPKIARFEKGTWMKLLWALVALGCFFSAYSDFMRYTAH